MNARETIDKICLIFRPLKCVCTGGKYGSDSIKFKIRDRDRKQIHRGTIVGSEWRSDDLLSIRLESEREAIEQKRYALDPL